MDGKPPSPSNLNPPWPPNGFEDDAQVERAVDRCVTITTNVSAHLRCRAWPTADSYYGKQASCPPPDDPGESVVEIEYIVRGVLNEGGRIAPVRSVAENPPSARPRSRSPP